MNARTLFAAAAVAATASLSAFAGGKRERKESFRPSKILVYGKKLY